MTEGKNNKIKWLNIRLSKTDYDQIAQYFSQSSHAAISSYARDILLKKPLVIAVRNQSEDDMMTELIQLKNELKAIGKNFNQAVKKLNALKQVKDMEHWLILFEMDKRSLEKHYESIDANIKKMTEKWLQ
jgi:septal ring factor EnvC (AmiA/AmiB activator)